MTRLLSTPFLILLPFLVTGYSLGAWIIYFAINQVLAFIWVGGIYLGVLFVYDRAVTFRKPKEKIV